MAHEAQEEKSIQGRQGMHRTVMQNRQRLTAKQLFPVRHLVLIIGARPIRAVRAASGRLSRWRRPHHLHGTSLCHYFPPYCRVERRSAVCLVVNNMLSHTRSHWPGMYIGGKTIHAQWAAETEIFRHAYQHSLAEQ